MHPANDCFLQLKAWIVFHEIVHGADAAGECACTHVFSITNPWFPKDAA